VVVTITASSFVRRMVRNIVSALVHVGRGQVPPSHVGELLQMRDREQLTREGCEPAPAHGLYLMNVNYDLSAKELQERKKQWRAMYK
jgi:tRNA pseudouridine38-40 synthase